MRGSPEPATREAALEKDAAASETNRFLYSFGDSVVAERATTNSTNWLVYLHAAQLGSVSLITNTSAQQVSVQDFTPWGSVRTGGVPASTTTLNYTGQRLDGTGLLYYNARYYDPALGRFLSADSIVPGAASGAGGAADTLGPDAQQALRPLTVDFHEPGFLAGISQEDAFTQQKGFWFELSSSDRGKAKIPWGPANPQALNRYSYALDNPLRYSDPTGHTVYFGYEQAVKAALAFRNAASTYNEMAAVIGVAGAAAAALAVLSLIGALRRRGCTRSCNPDTWDSSRRHAAHLDRRCNRCSAQDRVNYGNKGVAVEFDGQNVDVMDLGSGEVMDPVHVAPPSELPFSAVVMSCKRPSLPASVAPPLCCIRANAWFRQRPADAPVPLAWCMDRPLRS